MVKYNTVRKSIFRANRILRFKRGGSCLRQLLLLHIIVSTVLRDNSMLPKVSHENILQSNFTEQKSPNKY